MLDKEESNKNFWKTFGKQVSKEQYLKIPKWTKENLLEILDEMFKDYRDPTEGMSIEQKEEFHNLMKEEFKKEPKLLKDGE